MMEKSGSVAAAAPSVNGQRSGQERASLKSNISTPPILTTFPSSSSSQAQPNFPATTDHYHRMHYERQLQQQQNASVGASSSNVLPASSSRNGVQLQQQMWTNSYPSE